VRSTKTVVRIDAAIFAKLFPIKIVTIKRSGRCFIFFKIPENLFFAATIARTFASESDKNATSAAEKNADKKKLTAIAVKNKFDGNGSSLTNSKKSPKKFSKIQKRKIKLPLRFYFYQKLPL
jgi:hypothetical protein